MVEDEVGVSGWKSEAAQERFARLYAAASDDLANGLERAGRGRPHVSDVTSRFGTARCRHWAGSGIPLVLLHGHNGSWLSWGPMLAAMPGRAVYALDTVGEPGGSTQTAPMASAEDLVAWLDETLDALQLPAVHLAGMSYGGWIAAHVAAAHPRRVASLVLLEPAIDRVTMKRVLRHGMAVGLATALPPPARRWFARRIDAEPLVFDPGLRKPSALAFRKFDRRLPTYAQLEDPSPDSMLAAIEAPTLLVLGGRSELHDVDRVADRAGRLIRDLELHIVDGASHAVPVTRPETVAPLVLDFLDRLEGTARAAV